MSHEDELQVMSDAMVGGTLYENAVATGHIDPEKSREVDEFIKKLSQEQDRINEEARAMAKEIIDAIPERSPEELFRRAAEAWVRTAFQQTRNAQYLEGEVNRLKDEASAPEKEPTRAQLIDALDLAMAIIENEVPPSAYEVNMGPDAGGDDANAALLGSMVRRLSVTLDLAMGREGPATKMAKQLGEYPF